IALMSSINIYSLYRSKDWIFPERQLHIATEHRPGFRFQDLDLVNGGLRPNWHRIQVSGTHLTIWDYVQIFSERANLLVDKGAFSFGNPSEAPIVLGFLTIAIGLIGLIVSSENDDKVWLNLLAIFICLSLGKDGFIFEPLVRAIPIFGLVRHTHCLVLYVDFCFLFYVV